MTRWARNSYTIQAEGLGLSKATIAEALRQAYCLQDKDLPAILTLGHLAHRSGLPYRKLHHLVQREKYTTDSRGRSSLSQRSNYRTFKIRKRSGGFRRICIPSPILLIIQKWIDKYILSQTHASQYSYAFENGKSIVDCARQHVECTWMIKIDLRNFFESLTEKQVYFVFKRIGYNNLVSFQLARICTKQHGVRKWNKKKWETIPRGIIAEYKAHSLGHLPQGAPTSPRLSNLIAYDLDIELSKIATDYNLTFTRYADDMVFSTNDPEFSRKKAKAILRLVYNILPKHGLEINPQKISITPPGARKLVLGLLVDGKEPRLSKEFRGKIDCHWYHCSIDQIKHARNRGFKILGLINHVKGLIAYANQVEPTFVEKLNKKYGPITWIIS